MGFFFFRNKAWEGVSVLCWAPSCLQLEQHGGVGGPLPCSPQREKGALGGARCLQDGAKQQRQGKCSVGSYLGPIPTWDGEGGLGEDTLGAGGGSVGPGLGPQKLGGAGEQPQALVLQLLAGWDTAPQSPPQFVP